jgi:uracil-DNA glycosylase/DNA polymerase I-like protein with 3'-5' exonuclease and polymerase domains
MLIVGEAPGREEGEAGRAFVGSAGQLMDELLERAGLHRADIPCTNAVLCRPPRNRTPTPEELSLCRPLLDRQLAAFTGSVIVAMGGTATHALTGMLVPDLRWDERLGIRNWAYKGITSWRGYPQAVGELAEEIELGTREGEVGTRPSGRRVNGWVARAEALGIEKPRSKAAAPAVDATPELWKWREGDPMVGKITVCAPRATFAPGTQWVMPSLHPASLIHGGFKDVPAFIADLWKARRLVAGDEPLPDPVVSTSIPELISEMETVEAAVGISPLKPVVACDIETSGLDPRVGSVTQIGFAFAAGKAYSVPWNMASAAITRRLLANRGLVLRFQNGQFDRVHLRAQGIHMLADMDDTLLKAQMVEPDMPKNLNWLLSLYLLCKRHKHLAGANPTKYNGMDAERLFPLSDALDLRLDEIHMADHVRDIVLPGMSALADATAFGIRVDDARLATWGRRLDHQIARLERIFARVADTPPDFNMGSWQQVLAKMRELVRAHNSSVRLRKDTLPVPENTQKATFAGLAQRGFAPARVMLMWKHLAKLRGMFLNPANYHWALRTRDMREGTLRCHPWYMPHGKDNERHEDKVLAATGRRAAKNPNIQQVEEAARVVFIADEGMELWEVDMSQVEAWLTVIECEDETMLDILLSGEKLHDWMHRFLQAELPAEVARQVTYRVSKRCVHSTNYGAGKERVRLILQDDNIFMPQHIVTRIHGTIQAAWPQRTTWQRDQVEKALRQGWLANAFGRRRRFFSRADAAAAIAFVPASNLADMMLTVLAQLRTLRPLAPFGAHLLWDNHDSLGGQSPRGEMTDRALRTLASMMERTWPQITGPDWPWWCPVTAKRGPNWRDLREWDHVGKETDDGQR